MNFNKPLMKIIKIIILIFPIANVNAENNELCLSGVCIDDDAVLLDINWIAVNKDELRRNRGYGELDKKYLSINNKSLDFLVPYIASKKFDKASLKHLLKASQVCEEFTLVGKFKTKSGFTTDVITIPEYNDNKLRLRVVRLGRTFWGVGGESINGLKIALKKRFPEIYTERYYYQIERPHILFENPRIGAASLSIVAKEPHRTNVNYKNITECKSNELSID